MLRLRSKTTLLTAWCLSSALVCPAGADTSSPQALLLSAWAEFSEVCAPLLVNPETARDNFPSADLGYFQYGTDGGEVTDRIEGFNGFVERSRNVVILIGSRAASVQCEIGRLEDNQPFSSESLAEALQQLVSQSDGVELFGGKMSLVDAAVRNGQAELNYDGLEGATTYFLEGALGPRPEFIEFSFGQGLLSLYMAATVLREDWQ